MDQWRTELHISWRAQWLSLLLHGTVILFLLLAPWPPGYSPVWIVLLTLVVFECVRSQRRILHRDGVIALLNARQLHWRQQEWWIVRRPWLSAQGVLLTLRSVQGQRERLWLMSDSMDESAWRRLRQCLLNPTDGDK